MKFDDVVNLQLQSSFFVESPMYYDASFNERMQEDDYNLKVALNIVQNNKKFDNFLSYDVYKIQDGFNEDVFTYCLIENNIIHGFMEIWSSKSNNFSRGVWQKDDPKNKGLMRNFVLEFLPKYYDNIISDKTSNEFGKQFYKKLLNGAIEKAFKVNVLKGSLKNEIPFIIGDFEDYWHNVDNDIPTHPTFVTKKDYLFKIYFK